MKFLLRHLNSNLRSLYPYKHLYSKIKSDIKRTQMEFPSQAVFFFLKKKKSNRIRKTTPLVHLPLHPSSSLSGDTPSHHKFVELVRHHFSQILFLSDFTFCFRIFHYKKVNPNVESQSYATKIQRDF